MRGGTNLVVGMEGDVPPPTYGSIFFCYPRSFQMIMGGGDTLSLGGKPDLCINSW